MFVIGWHVKILGLRDLLVVSSQDSGSLPCENLCINFRLFLHHSYIWMCYSIAEIELNNSVMFSEYTHSLVSIFLSAYISPSCEVCNSFNQVEFSLVILDSQI
jgi:hypothetical protein